MSDYVERIAEDWIRSHGDIVKTKNVYDPLLVIEVIIEANAHWSWLIISSIIQLDEAEESLNDLTYGPLDSWINRYAADWIDFIEGEARSNRRFKKMLGGLNKGLIHDGIWARIEIARAPS